MRGSSEAICPASNPAHQLGRSEKTQGPRINVASLATGATRPDPAPLFAQQQLTQLRFLFW